MITARQKQIAHQVLKILKQSEPHMLTEEILLDWLIITLNPRVINSELQEALTRLEAQHKIFRLRTDDEVKVKITDEGKAALLE